MPLSLSAFGLPGGEQLDLVIVLEASHGSFAQNGEQDPKQRQLSRRSRRPCRASERMSKRVDSFSSSARRPKVVASPNFTVNRDRDASKSGSQSSTWCSSKRPPSWQPTGRATSQAVSIATSLSDAMNGCNLKPLACSHQSSLAPSSRAIDQLRLLAAPLAPDAKGQARSSHYVESIESNRIDSNPFDSARFCSVLFGLAELNSTPRLHSIDQLRAGRQTLME